MSPSFVQSNFPRNHISIFLKKWLASVWVPTHGSPHCWFRRRRMHPGQNQAANCTTKQHGLRCHHNPKHSYKLKPYSWKKSLHRVPNFYFFCSGRIHSMERNKANKTRCMQWWIKYSVCNHRRNQAANWLVDTCLAIVGLSKYFS